MVVILRIARGLLRLRYIVLGSAAAGGIHASKKIDEWKEKVPDFGWITEMFPDSEKVDRFRDALEEIVNKYSSDGFFSKATGTASEKYDLLKQWIEEAKMNRQKEMNRSSDLPPPADAKLNGTTESPINNQHTYFQTTNSKDSQSSSSNLAASQQEKLSKLQNELMSLQVKYQKEIDRLEKDNKELRKQVLLRTRNEKIPRNIRKSLIEMYSDVLDELGDFDTSYKTQDHLPRVVVIGDQSAGKTSVLEMIAGARIFPRGGGEMMTRSPVKVTLSEGPYHIAKFKDSSREYYVSNENELIELRNEIEQRMKNSVKGGRTVSSEVISLSVEGPGIPRMVLVDLPGMINTVTSEMAQNTREAIREISQMYMSNPNAIILCIQDGSVDAERSLVTEMVSQMDPNGKRTIFVLTKVDLAEQNMTNPSRIRKILDGKLFPMKALGYFAVVTGRGDKDERIESIKRYEEEFFSNSQLCRDGILNASQCSTQSLSLAVSECFWRMVKASVEQQADSYKALRFNLETEWMNSFPRMREWDRDELFEKAKSQLFDEIINLSQLNPTHWEEILSKKLRDKVRNDLIEDMYLPAYQIDNKGLFKTHIDIKLKQWVENELPSKSVEVGREALRDEFESLIEKAKSNPNHDSILDKLEAAVVEESWKRHHWEPKASEVLKVIQLNALEDYLIPDKNNWEKTIDFMQHCFREHIMTSDNELFILIGPGWYERWTQWTSRTPEQQTNVAIKNELDKLLQVLRFKPSELNLDGDNITTVRQNLQHQGIDVEDESIQKVWNHLYRIHSLKSAIQRGQECRKCFFLYKQGIETEVQYDDVIVFWRILKTLTATTNALRQQIMNREERRLEKEVKDVLDEFSQDHEMKSTLLTGRRVELAEELKRVRLIQEKLEEFIAALEREK
ncbi:opa1 mitochondrial dynamin like GTPase isoform X2 [Brevipalpus obovatus]|uniref:opa1 mitochondrial dynamin like GTPase isoform X2 n=1 Tax=Brevipalpus obovatus TaxID=246614 RepID=UPI003D9F44E3